MLFSVQRAHGLNVWQEPYVTQRLPMLLNLRMDPFERAEFQGISAARQAGKLQSRPGAPKDAAPVAQLTK